MDKQKHTDSELIDALGGTAAVSRICQVKQPSVSQWREKGIPQARLMYLRVVRPDVFGAKPSRKTAKVA
jgi:hypothetical protein